MTQLHRTALAIVLLAAFGSASHAQPTYDVLASFDGSSGGGAKPFDELIQAGDRSFYGTTIDGGAAGKGAVFRFDGAGRLTILHSFTGADGAMPRDGVVEGRDGNLYGTTFFGGSSDAGTIFRMTRAGALTTLHRFAQHDGARPSAALLLARDGSFYGTTVGGGAFDAGTIFRLTAAGALTTIHEFAGDDGSSPFGRLLQARDGTFYGTTLTGGAHGAGTVFTVDAAGHVTTVHSFTGADGDDPSVGVIQAGDGAFYGTTDENDFSSGPGTIFRIDRNGTFKTIHRFDGADGFSPRARLLQASDGRIFGTTNSGVLGFGTIFTITAQGTVTTIHTFTGSDGGHSSGALIEAVDGDLYGTTLVGGAHGDGVLFRLNVIAQRVPSTADASVRSGTFAATNFGTASTLRVKKGATADNTSRAYLKFDIGQLDTASRVTLRLVGRVDNAGTAAVPIALYAVGDTSWDERTVTWNTRPDLGAVVGTFSAVGTIARALEVDVTAFVRRQHAAGLDVVAIALRAPTHTSAAAIVDAREAATGGAQLIVRR